MEIASPCVEHIDDYILSIKQKIFASSGFELTDGICPINGWEPVAGFQRTLHVDCIFGQLQLLAINQTKSRLFELFMELALKFIHIGKVKRGGVDAVFESRHSSFNGAFGKKYDCRIHQHYRDFITREVDPICFLSRLWDYEDLFVNDGFAGISVMSKAIISELRLDVHKTILFFMKSKKMAYKVANFLLDSGLQELPLEAAGIIDEAHVHIGHSDFKDKFDQLVASEDAEQVEL